jgi:hypothetical protein
MTVVKPDARVVARVAEQGVIKQQAYAEHRRTWTETMRVWLREQREANGALNDQHGSEKLRSSEVGESAGLV